MTDAGSASAELTVDLGDDYVATVEISRPPNNFFNVGLIEQIAAACQNLAAGGQCRAIVLCSAGRVFCAGADFTDPHTIGRPDGMHLYDYAIRIFEQPLRCRSWQPFRARPSAVGSAWRWPQTSELPHLKPGSPPTSRCSDSTKALRSA
jgi:hypothetical protein